MKKIVGLYVSDSGFSGIDFKNIDNGNPGIGGTQFEFVLLAYYLSQDERYEVIIFHMNENYYPERCQHNVVNDFEEAVKNASLMNVDCFICQSNLQNIVDYLEKYNQKAILWAHNFMRPHMIRYLAKCTYVTKIICVGDFEYKYVSLFTRKAYLIYNMVSPLEFESDSDSGVLSLK